MGDHQDNLLAGRRRASRHCRHAGELTGNGRITSYNVCYTKLLRNLSFVPASPNLVGAEVELVNVENREFYLKNALNTGANRYDYVIIDCPPSLNLLTINALVAANAVMVPLQCEFLALEGVTDLIQNIERIKKVFNPSLELHGVLLTMFDKRNNLSQLVEEDVRQFFGSKVYNTVIPRNVRVSEAPSHGKPVLLYDWKSPGAQAYISLAGEVLKREKELAA